MGFWDNVETSEDGTFEADGGFAPLPDNTEILAMISEAKIDDYQGDEYINVTWDVLKPEEHKNRKIFQKVRVYDEDQKKAEKARRMLGAIDQNAGGGLMASGEAPSDLNLMKHLANKMMFVKLGVWSMDTESGKKEGNWVKAVGPKSRYGEAPVQAPTNDNASEDNIPF